MDTILFRGIRRLNFDQIGYLSKIDDLFSNDFSNSVKIQKIIKSLTSIMNITIIFYTQIILYLNSLRVFRLI